MDYTEQAPREGDAMPELKTTAEQAADAMDWQQVLLNGGPPCFHLEDGRFCGRAQRWEGHGVLHEFVSLSAVFAKLTRERDAARDALRNYFEECPCTTSSIDRQRCDFCVQAAAALAAETEEQ